MPTYQYECSNCAHALEIWQSMLDQKMTKCPSCGKSTFQRLIGSGGGIIFKGSGFYETDYKKSVGSTEPASKVGCSAKTDSCPCAQAENS